MKDNDILNSFVNFREPRCLPVIVAVDRSGSMSGLEKDTIGGFNSLIAKQKKEERAAKEAQNMVDDEAASDDSADEIVTSEVTEAEE